MLPRRTALAGAGGLALAAALGGRAAQGVPAEVEVHMRSDQNGGVVGFDPVGLLIEPGQSVRWVCDANVHTTTAYSPVNGGHSLRIPKAARSWNSGFLEPGQHFTVRFTVEGVYDYFCMPHEEAGMVGRIIVGRPAGPGTLPFDYFKTIPADRGWLEVPAAARAAFPAVAALMRRKIVPSPLNFSAAYWPNARRPPATQPA